MTTSKPNVSTSSTTSGDMGQWSSGYNDALIAEIFGEKIDEYFDEIFNDIFYELIKTFFFSFE